ncbi:AglZ/HisF2 family acetamidino modification protein [Flaviaesturariibacter aridisoli]|uniref:imidazole glycerol-phosphate synthase n=1 Tax=Flaviaesturariibacter aridisoli TaxID=2545761 RepID=A0A4R4E164_9BACT|nr:AglZ/HisF2 family acetamidino modification protein [Flaviaesturariibacter aridisoli]TCZ73126.1 imidazole glycerol phosphate synthase subunit HisF [Flaviaesturariibacter aridisoli]
MRRIRVIPVLLIHEGGLVKSVKFKNYQYVGDPINAVKIFNDKEVDEICILNISNSKAKKGPDIQAVADIVSEAFMPVAYGGGVTTMEQAEKLFYNGVEKIVLNYATVTNPQLITDIAKRYGNQAVLVSIDYKSNWLGKSGVYTLNGSEAVKRTPVEMAQFVESLGAGEIMLNSIERDGTYAGYDLDTLEKVVAAVNIPVIACGGAGSVDDFRKAVSKGASAVAAGSMFVFQRPHNAVLISYPPYQQLQETLNAQ